MCGVGLCVGLCVACRGDVCVSSCLAPKTLPCVRSKRSCVHFQNARVTKDTGVSNVHTRAFRTSHGSVSLFSCLPLSSSRVSLFLSPLVCVVVCVVCLCGVVWCCVVLVLCCCVVVLLCCCVVVLCVVCCVCVGVCSCVWGVFVCCSVVLCGVGVVVKLGTREKAPCVDSKRLRVYVQDVSVCTGNRPACVEEHKLLSM